jgi:predicted nucleotidyltransferase component of viral defense system
MLRNLYDVDLGTSGLILQAESREEILADKIIALAFRENRIKNRDLWDIAWLVQRGVEFAAKLIPLKVREHQRDETEFSDLLQTRVQDLRIQPEMRRDFIHEMRRFLPAATVRGTIEQETYWQYLIQLLDEQTMLAIDALPT